MQTGLKKPMVRMVVEKFIGQVRTSIMNKERIEIRNLGIFKVKRIKPKKGRNLRTGEEVEIPERWKVVFKPSKYFDRLNSEKEQELPFDGTER